MRILAIETSSIPGSVAIQDGDPQIALSLPAELRTARALAPMIQQILSTAGIATSDLELIACTQGPGSFTGLRVGAMTAKAIAYVACVPVVGVNALLAVANQCPNEVVEVWTVVDAQRGELFAARFERGHDGAWHTVWKPTIVGSDWWLERLKPNATVSGLGLARVRDRLPSAVRVVDEADWIPRAATIAELGKLQFAAGEASDAWEFVPHYYRRSAAEEKLERNSTAQ